MNEIDEIKGILNSKLKEKEISNIIINYKKDMEIIIMKKKILELSKKERILENELRKNKIEQKKFSNLLIKTCTHHSIDLFIYDNYDSKEYIYFCDICNQNITNEKFNYNNIKKTNYEY